MSTKRTSRSPDLQQLREDGYDWEIRSGHLLLKCVPYVNARKEVARGTLVTVLTLAGDLTAPPADHTVMWIGEYPCRADGAPIESIRNSSGRQVLDRGLEIDHRFSNKRSDGKPDENFRDKMIRYVTILSGPAAVLDPSATACVNQFVESPDEDSPLVYADSASTDAGIFAVSRKLELRSVGIVGVGGIGAYVLDLVAKTRVREIHLFDGDVFLQHSAFRSPGAASCDELRAILPKVDYYLAKYSKMHRGIVPHGFYLDAASLEELRGLDFVFLCLDRGSVKKDIIAKLVEWQIPFIDVGMDVRVTDDALGGILTGTTGTKDKHDHLARRLAYADADPDADYSKSIHIADLNMLNAALAVIRWKKHCGFYRDFGHEHFTAYSIDTNSLANEEMP